MTKRCRNCGAEFSGRAPQAQLCESCAIASKARWERNQPGGQPEQKEIDVYELELSQFNKIVFSLTEFKGKWYINIRTWGKVHPAQANWLRSQKGVFIEVQKWPQFLKGINQLDEEIYKLLTNSCEEGNGKS